MRGQRDYTDYLTDILDAAENAERFLAGMGIDEFLADAKTSYAVIRALTIIGEAAKRIPPSVRKQYPEIPWRAVAAMRDKVTHDYFGVDLRRVYETVRREIPELRRAVERMVTDLAARREDRPSG